VLFRAWTHDAIRRDVNLRLRRLPTALIEHKSDLANTQDVRRAVHGPLDGTGNAGLPHHLLDSRILLPRQRPGAERPTSDEFASPAQFALLYINTREDNASQCRRH